MLILGALSSVSQLHCGERKCQKAEQALLGIGCSPYPEKFAQARVVGLARLALGIFQVLCEPEAQDLEHAVDGIVRGADGYKCIGGIEIVPVFEIGGGLEELGRQREADRGEIGNTDEPEDESGQGRGRNAGAERAGGTNFLRMPMKMRSLELSLWLSSAAESVVTGGAAVDDMVGKMRWVP